MPSGLVIHPRAEGFEALRACKLRGLSTYADDFAFINTLRGEKALKSVLASYNQSLAAEKTVRITANSGTFPMVVRSHNSSYPLGVCVLAARLSKLFFAVFVPPVV